MKNIIIIIALVVIVGAAGFVYYQKSGSSLNPSVTESPTSTPEPTETVKLLPISTPASSRTPVSTAKTTPVSTRPSIPIVLPTSHEVTIEDSAFVSSSITIKKGDTVVWTNNDSMSHTVTSDTGDFSSPTLNLSHKFNFKFDTIGTYNYHCSLHPSMVGTIIVTQ